MTTTVTENYDVVVCGGGLAGFAAAVAAGSLDLPCAEQACSWRMQLIGSKSHSPRRCQLPWLCERGRNPA